MLASRESVAPKLSVWLFFSVSDLPPPVNTFKMFAAAASQQGRSLN